MSDINTAMRIIMDHSPCIADDVPLGGFAEDIAKAIKAERERCAKLAMDMGHKHGKAAGTPYEEGTWDQAVRIAGMIRNVNGAGSP